MSLGKLHYTVLRIKDSTLVYSGHSEAKAACALDPGTVFGKGASREESLAAARKQVGKCSDRE